MSAPRLTADELEPILGAALSPGTETAQRDAALHALVELAKASPARVSKKLAALESLAREAEASSTVRAVLEVLVTLCHASNSYHRKLEGTFARVVERAQPADLLLWTQLVLPALKGEPHANVRAIAEARLPKLPEAEGKALAAQLNLRWRPAR